MIAADIHQTACLDKCNRIVSNLIASPSFGCIYVMTRTLNPAVRCSFPANTVCTLVASGDFEAKTTRQRPKLRATRLSPQSPPSSEKKSLKSEYFSWCNMRPETSHRGHGGASHRGHLVSGVWGSGYTSRCWVLQTLTTCLAFTFGSYLAMLSS